MNLFSSKNKRPVVLYTDHGEGVIEKEITTLDRLNKGWGKEYTDYVVNIDPNSQCKKLTTQIKKTGEAYFNTKYRSMFVKQLTNKNEVKMLVSGEYDDPGMSDFSPDDDIKFEWTTSTPKELYSKLENMGVPRKYYRSDNRSRRK